MQKLKKITKLLLGLLVLSLILSLILSFTPVRKKSISVTKGFTYGQPSQQVTTKGDGTYIRSWYGFPITTKEQETVKYKTNAYYDSAIYTIQSFNNFFALLNVLFWWSALVTVLSPVTIFWRPKKQNEQKPKTLQDDKESSAVTVDSQLSSPDQASAGNENQAKRNQARANNRD